MNQVILNNGMRTNASNIKFKRSKLFGKKFDIKLLETLYTLRGRDLKTKGISAAMGYSPKSAAVTPKINKAIDRLEADGYLRVNKTGAYQRQFFVLKGIPEVDKQLPAYVVVEKPGDDHAEAEKLMDEHNKNIVLSETLYPDVNLTNLVGSLKASGVRFKLTISSEGNNEKANNLQA